MPRGLLKRQTVVLCSLDELTSLPREIQPKLLRVLENGEIRRLGDTQKRRVRVRFIGAAQPELARQIRNGDFRNDLFQRLAGGVIELPSLAERREDIPAIVNACAQYFGRKVTDAALRVLSEREWRGNVRELRMVVERASSISDSIVLSVDVFEVALEMGAAFTSRIRAASSDVPPRERVLEIFAENDWSAERTARALGIGRTTLFKEMKTLGISVRELRSNVAMRARRLLEES